MEQDGANQSQNMPSSAASLCRLGCGFYANTAFDGLCSKCYKDVLKRQKQGLQPSVQSVGGQSSTVSDFPAMQPDAVNISSATRDQSPTDSVESNPDATSVENRFTVSPRSVDTSSVCSAMNSASISGQADRVSPALGSRVSPSTESTVATADDGETGTQAAASFMQDTDALSVVSSLDDDNRSESSTPSDAEAKGGKPKRNRCHTCKKKVALTGFECRCGGLYCSLHRYSDMHQCSFNYKEHGQEELRKSNPVVVSSKIQKI